MDSNAKVREHNIAACGVGFCNMGRNSVGSTKIKHEMVDKGNTKYHHEEAQLRLRKKDRREGKIAYYAPANGMRLVCAHKAKVTCVLCAPGINRVCMQYSSPSWFTHPNPAHPLGLRRC